MITYKEAITALERELIPKALAECKGNQTKAAKLLGLKMGTVRKSLKKHNLDGKYNQATGS